MTSERSGSARRLAALLLASLLPACATTPQWDAHFGDTVRIARAQQVLNPAAAGNADPVAGLDGRSARSALERYHKSFATPEPVSNSFTIGVSGGK